MFTRVLGAAALSLALSSVNSPAHSGAMQRISCSMVRFYVARYSAAAAESYARSHGATDAQIDAARRCLKDMPSQTAEAARWNWR
jgi:hypothetical protein